MRTLYAIFNNIGEIRLTKSDAEKCSHIGDCEQDVEIVRKKWYVKKQLRKISIHKLQKELKEYGAWDEQELLNHDENLKRILWLSAGQIKEEHKK